MRLRGTGSWRIVAVTTATLAALVFGILWLRGNRAQPKEDHVDGYRSIAARLVDERQLPPRQKRITRRGDRTGKLPPAKPGPAADGRVTTMVLNGQAGAAIQKLRREAKGGDPEALTNLAAALLTHRLAIERPPDWEEDSFTFEALAAARKAIARSPTLAAAHFNLALALEQLGFTQEARVEFENAATLESDGAWSAEARRRARELGGSDPLAVAMAARRYISATASPASRTILKEYLEARERTGYRPQWNGGSVYARIEKAAQLYDSGVSGPELLPRVFSQAAMALSPDDQGDLYKQHYLIAGGLHRARRSDEAIALLHTLDADVFRTYGPAGWRAQIVCEDAIQMIVRHSPAEALDLLRDAFHSSAAKGEPKLTALYASLADEVRTHLLQSALRAGDIPTALEYTDPPVEIADREGERLVKYGDLLDVLKLQRADGGLNGVGLIASKKSPVIAPPKKSVEEAQLALRPDAAIIEYAIRDQVIVFVIRKNDVQTVSLYASASDVKNAADALRRADDESFAVAAGRLYELIVAPVAARLEGVSTIAFVAHRDLAGIPFGALLDVQRGQFLIERFAVVHAPSTRAAITASRALKPAREQKVLAIAATDFDRERYPGAAALPGARREADSIATLSRCARLLVGPAATPEAIQRQLVENVVIHYAGHIVRRGADVWLPLMPAAGRDGLSATEIARLPLKNARVVVLAACRGASPGEADDVMPTMAEAFLTAGAPAVIASSYDVDDTDAPATMRRLHTYLRDGDDAANALRKTTIDELRRGRGVPPSLRFMAIGGASSLVN
jgi:CHAT domain-containing protein